ERFTPDGILLKSGNSLPADIIVTATGLKLMFLGGLEVWVDGAKIDFPQALTYKGMMYGGVPNLASAFGYTNASWTLKCDLTCEYVCRLLNHMDRTHTDYCVPQRNDPAVTEEPFLDFSSGYVQRALHLMPKQGSKAPWKLYQNYARDLVALRFGRLDDGTMSFAKAAKRTEAGAAQPALEPA
ncbi:MAG TPA: NAD(P)/FAD-dependent oxidoreductase, partial [Acetobacteraceae bacterium]|nr:NAD(P)/FAD-dependent oxidoreductase [Acetobacteraceae bacterium]